MTTAEPPPDVAATSGARPHWEAVYQRLAADQVSWFQKSPARSAELLTRFAGRTSAVVDIGGGESNLADALLEAGWTDLTILDVSSQALAAVRERLGEQGKEVSLIASDMLTWQPTRLYDAWHDRAAFHFLVDPADRARYVAIAAAAISPGGVLVIGTFAADGPSQCSGLPTARYGAEALADCFAPGFTMEHDEREEHVTPAGIVQPFTWVVLRRR